MVGNFKRLFCREGDERLDNIDWKPIEHRRADTRPETIYIFSCYAPFLLCVLLILL